MTTKMLRPRDTANACAQQATTAPVRVPKPTSRSAMQLLLIGRRSSLLCQLLIQVQIVEQRRSPYGEAVLPAKIARKAALLPASNMSKRWNRRESTS
jgi:hypothetical protein